MKAYGKKAQIREARAYVMDEMSACAEHFDLIVLMVLHDVFGFGAKRLTAFYRAFSKKYDEYKRRYLAADESTVCGNRTDTFVLKKHLREIGFDYDAICNTILAEDEQQKKGDVDNGITE